MNNDVLGIICEYTMNSLYFNEFKYQKIKICLLSNIGSQNFIQMAYLH